MEAVHIQTSTTNQPWHQISPKIQTSSTCFWSREILVLSMKEVFDRWKENEKRKSLKRAFLSIDTSLILFCQELSLSQLFYCNACLSLLHFLSFFFSRHLSHSRLCNKSLLFLRRKKCILYYSTPRTNCLHYYWNLPSSSETIYLKSQGVGNDSDSHE